jgi:hypothetical protein
METENFEAAAAEEKEEEIMQCPFKRMKFDADVEEQEAIDAVTSVENAREVSNGDDGEKLQADTSDEFIGEDAEGEGYSENGE